jgi:hypothetical protein
MKFVTVGAFTMLCSYPAVHAFLPQRPPPKKAFRTSLAATVTEPTITQKIEELEERASAQLKELESRRLLGRRPPSYFGPSPILSTSSEFGELPTYDVNEIFHQSKSTTVQGGSLRTWSFTNPRIEFVQVMLKTEGRPLDADIQLWNGPDNTPQKMKVYVEDGALRTFNALIATPQRTTNTNTIAIRNTGMLEFPLTAFVNPDRGQGQDAALAVESSFGAFEETIQGGALRTWPFESDVSSVAVLLKTPNGRPLNERIELLQGPNNNRQVIQLYTEEGLYRPFFASIETPGSGNVIRILNTAPMEFPLTATVQAYSIGNSKQGAGWAEKEGILFGHARYTKMIQ